MTTELDELRKDVARNRKEIEKLLARLDGDERISRAAMDRQVKKTTALLKRLSKALWKHRGAFIAIFGLGFGARQVPEKYRLGAYLLALAPLVQLVLKAVRNAVDYTITYNVAIPLLLAYHALVFAINSITTLAWLVVRLAVRAKNASDASPKKNVR